MRPFTLDLDLGPLPADLTEVDREIGGRLDPYEPELTRRAVGLDRDSVEGVELMLSRAPSAAPAR